MITPSFLMILFILYIILMIVFFKYDPTGSVTGYQGLSIFLTLLGGTIIILLWFLSAQNEPFFKWSDLRNLSFTRPQGPANRVAGVVAQPLQRPILGSMKSFMELFIILFLFIGILIGAIMIIVYSVGDTSSSSVTSGIFTSLNIIFGIGILVFIASMISKSKDNTLISLMFNLVMYIPCLILDIINAVKKEYKSTTPIAVMVLGFDVALYFAIWVLPKIIKYLFDVPGQQLINEPIYTDQPNVLANYENLAPDINGKKTKYKYNYALSCWIYINPQPPNTGEEYTTFTSLLNYGNKPNILYKADTNTIMIKMKIKNDDEKIIYKSNDFLLQRWNNIIVNYDGGTLDVFINNKLVVSQDSVVPYMSFDQLTCGSTNGIQGGICNVKYYERVLNINEINQVYNSVKNKDPPIFSQ